MLHCCCMLTLLSQTILSGSDPEVSGVSVSESKGAKPHHHPLPLPMERAGVRPQRYYLVSDPTKVPAYLICAASDLPLPEIMMTLEQRLDALVQLGDYIREALSSEDTDLQAVIQRAYIENPWFTPTNTRDALIAISERMLTRSALIQWLSNYTLLKEKRRVALIMAGNLPLVGFHDWLCVFIAGHRAKVKLSDKDKLLLPFLIKKMAEFAFESWAETEFIAESDTLKNFDAVIATGSNNTARYFEQYFGAYPHIIRRNRNAVAVLSGQEDKDSLLALGIDITAYFGLGCRNVSKIYVPQGYNFEPLLTALHEYRDLVVHNKYKNNFDYNMTLLILNQTPFMNNGCVILLENEAFTSRIANLHYTFYQNEDELHTHLVAHRDEIQCIATQMSWPDLPVVAFGHTQQPGLSDYPDGVDVMAFLCQ
jgi:hypothetical protein